jgi:protoporphyrinogen oxidase
LFSLGLWTSLLVFLSYLRAKIFPDKPEETLEQWVSNRFGKRLYEIFFKTYTEKVWGISADSISADWAAQRIKGLSLSTVIMNAFFQKNAKDKDGVITTLINSFNYPKRGPGMMWEAVAAVVQREEGQIHLGTEVERIFWKKNKVENLEIKVDGKTKLAHGSNFISSMPIRELLLKFEPVVPGEVLKAAMNLKYRDFITVALIVNRPDMFADNWIYIHDSNVKVGRIQNFKNWSSYMVPDLEKTCVGLEYFCFEGDELWNMPDEGLIELGRKELEILGLAEASDVQDGAVVKMPKAYPVYDTTYRESLHTIREFLAQIDNLQVVGRNGMHKYNNQDHSMLTAMMAVENILGANHDLWQVNEEKGYLEESVRKPREMATLEKAFASAFARMDKLALATALGSVSGLLIFLSTIFLVLKGGDVTEFNLQLLGQYFFGYTVTVKGAFIGMAYSFSWGFLFGWLFAYLRNFFLAFLIYRVRRKFERLSLRDFLDHF